LQHTLQQAGIEKKINGDSENDYDHQNHYSQRDCTRPVRRRTGQPEYTAPQQSISAESQNQLIQNYGLAAVAPGKSSVAQRYLVKRQISRANHVDYTLSTPVFFN
jgi:hypothetical protein